MPTRKKLAGGCRGCLGCFGILVLLAAVLIPILYLEENWRGAEELAVAKKRWQEAGYSLNPADYYPPPVPDDQNLAALPIFKLEADPNDPNHPPLLTDVSLRAAVDEDKHGGYLVYRYDPKTKKYVNDLAANIPLAYAKMFPGKTPPASLLAQLEELYPVVADLRTAAQVRPKFRMNFDYGHQPPWVLSLGPITTQIHIAKLFSYDMQLATGEKQPQVAADDASASLRIAKSVGTMPALVAGLVSLGECAIVRSKVDDGLNKHLWNDTQLAQIQYELKQIDFLAMFRFDMQTEAVVFALPMYDYLKKQPALLQKIAVGFGDDSDGARLVPLLLWRIWATGWWDMNATKMLNTRLRDLSCVDINKRLVKADQDIQLTDELEKARKMPGGVAPWNILYAVSAGSVSNALKKFAQGQVQLDEDRIACALERYRLAHTMYPATLDSLAPTYIDALPHDIMNGEPYHYRLNADGTFLLYSVGWNQIDDGGKVVMRTDVPTMQDYSQGDWVWPTPKR